MLIPIGDEPNDPKRIAWMNYALIAANVIVFLWMKVTYPTDEAFGAFLLEYGYLPSDGSLASIFTSMFLHAGWLHVGGNMLFLWIFGDNIEARLGAIGYLVAYLAVGVAATLIYGAFNADATLPAVGASGAISGVQGLYFIACSKHRVKVFVFLYIFISVIKVNARLIMGFWFVMQDVIPTLINIKVNVSDNVAHMAHLGGFASGLALMLILKPLAPGVASAERAERGRTGRYKSGGARSRKYERHRRKNPYESGVRRRSEFKRDELPPEA